MTYTNTERTTAKTFNRTKQKNFSTRLYKSSQLHTRGKLPRFVTNNKLVLFTGQSHLTTRWITLQTCRDQTINHHDDVTDDTRVTDAGAGRGDVRALRELARD